MSLAAPASGREAVYARLRRRNRVVGVLRVAVPLAGAAVLAVIVGGLVIGTISDRFGFANISIDRDNLVVDAPRLSATAANGNVYSVTATSARAPMGSLDAIDVTGGVLSMRTPEGREMTASYDRANLETADQVVTVHGIASVAGNDGTTGTVADIVWDIRRQALRSSGKLDLTLPGDRHVAAESATYDAASGLWHFSHVVVTLPTLPGGTP